MEEKQIHDELTSIRSLMERSSKFISLSGLSGILAGVYALVGAGVAYYIIYQKEENDNGNLYHDFYYYLPQLALIALLVLIFSISTGVLLSIRKAKREKQPIWGETGRNLLFQMATPLIAGGLFIMIFARYYDMIAPAMLVFYGLALISASRYTFSTVKYLGLCEIILGLIAACLPGYGLLFWAIGFGVLHIVYGSLMYIKYDR